jgi:hypothetical protein
MLEVGEFGCRLQLHRSNFLDFQDLAAMEAHMNCGVTESGLRTPFR